jgi:hypothetical protein
VITICDTGPLIAYLNRRDPYHDHSPEELQAWLGEVLTVEEKAALERSIGG